jgi:fructose-1,6-bisphosphatase/inositol monophosphatase family enzyme
VSSTYGRDLVRIEPAVWHARSLGDFWQHALVAEGSVDAAVDARLAPWDYSALVPILQEAGRLVTALDVACVLSLFSQAASRALTTNHPPSQA